MRLFIALPLDGELRASLARTRDAIAARSPGCTPTRDENFHLTLAFLGEQPDGAPEELRQCMCSAAGGPFILRPDGLGCFPRGDECLWWAGVERSPELMGLAERLAAALRARGFALEDRPFFPHLTLARRVRQPLDAAALPAPEGEQRVSAMVLFRSDRPGGVLSYTPLAQVDL